MNKLLFEIKSTGGCVYRAVDKWINYGTFRKRARYAKYYQRKKIRTDTILYEAFYGRGMLCNPYAIFLQLLNDSQYHGMKHVWVLDNLKAHQDLLKLYSKYSNVVFIQKESKEYLRYLCTAKYLINNSTFPTYFSKKPGQIYINTWHGIPLKYLGYDIPNGNIEVSNIIRNFLHTDYILSANAFLTEIYESSFKLREIYEGKIIEEGYPRLDLLFQFSKEEVFQKLAAHGVRLEPNKKIILYAPTWKGNSFQNADTDIQCYFNVKQGIEERINTDEYQILVKVHQRVYELCKDELTESFFVPATIDANEILSVTDILISDFSSIYFDFLTTGRPILFFIEDARQYAEERGFYAGLDTLPGPYTDSLSIISEWINTIDTVQVRYAGKYRETLEWSSGVWDSSISKKIVDIIFRGREEGYRVIRQEHKKKHILIHRGKMRVNGISTALVSLLNGIDYDHYDVSVMLSDARTMDEKNLINKIHPKARILYRNSTHNITLRQEVQQMYLQRHGRYKLGSLLLKQEFHRVYGDAVFNYAVDFDGYNSFFSSLILQCPNAVKSVWMHSDMYAEYELRMSWLINYFPLYNYFDRIVSCSKEIMLVNREKLAGQFGSYDAFTYAKNFVNIEDILAKKEYQEKRTFEGSTYIMTNESSKFSYITGKMIPYIPEQAENGERNYRFVAVGRLSPEKNYDNLILGFYRLYNRNSNAYLYIVGGGTLWGKLNSMVEKLGLQEHVFITNSVDNPISIMKNCDCFILTSFYEGQPMVVHEARVLHMPIIFTDFPSANGIKIENGQYVIGTSEKEICDGMNAYIDGKVPVDYVFDGEAYNKEAYEEWIQAIM